ncbi:hypothetical protein E2C01_034317 [Portunus trituberculatus]|uniref:Uncharacterized protein n=1 Tax=Portunus trituberculatus TaxID=210409 RepID=A0A5B7F1B1_PORTR|nr:hypothetical protein [Portunus trituberculatus]
MTAQGSSGVIFYDLTTLQALGSTEARNRTHESSLIGIAIISLVLINKLINPVINHQMFPISCKEWKEKRHVIEARDGAGGGRWLAYKHTLPSAMDRARCRTSPYARPK